MDVSVIIVNYNVEHFLSQCLLSVRAGVAVLEQAGHGGGICGRQQFRGRFVRDGSAPIPGSAFDRFKKNLGFSKGNNLAIRQSKGRWVLLNPDTIIRKTPC